MINKILFAFTYPRLDMEVSKKMNHLLKAPFCVHPKTGKVCVPIRVADAEAFNPEQVITVQQLVTELSNSVSTQVGRYSFCTADSVQIDDDEFSSREKHGVPHAWPRRWMFLRMSF